VVVVLHLGERNAMSHGLASGRRDQFIAETR
jgi:hypothetical protein